VSPRWPDTREPYERVGHCCGCGHDRLLVRVAESRYRCAERCAPLEARGHRTSWTDAEPLTGAPREEP